MITFAEKDENLGIGRDYTLKEMSDKDLEDNVFNSWIINKNIKCQGIESQNNMVLWRIVNISDK